MLAFAHMTWGIYLGLSICAQAIANVCNRFVMRRAAKGTWAYAALSQIITAFAIAVYVFATGQFSMPPFVELWPWFVLTVSLNVGANIFQNEALRTAEASFFTIFASSRILVSMAAAAVVLSEQVSLIQGFGAVVMIAAIAIAFSKRFTLKPEPWMIPAALYALSSGLVFIGDAKIIGASTNVASYMIFGFGLPGIATLVLRPKIFPDMVAIARSREVLAMIVYSVVYGFMAITLWLAYQYGAEASQMAPIRQSAVILTVIIAIVFLRERDHIPQKVTAALLAILSVYFISAT